jgi:membrane associated rhomboid family serine protease
MGIYDREYYRREGPSFFRSLYETGTVCKWLIGINIAVYIIQLLTFPHGGGDEVLPGSSGWFTEFLDLNVGAVMHGEVWRLLTHAFLHSPLSPWHIIFNMLFLWWFGNEIEEMYGPREFLALYLTAALIGGLAFVGWDVATMPWGELQTQSALGASGAVNAVLVLYACHFPTRTIRLFFLIPVPVWLMVVIMVAMDVFGLLGPSGNGGVAVAAHLGGAAFAFLYYKRQWRLMSLWSWLWSKKPSSRPRLRVYREEEPAARPAAPVGVATAAKTDVDEHLEAKLDQVLEKVARFGQDSLTESERQILFRASEVYKRKRT